VTILPHAASDTLFEPESTALNDRRTARRFRFGFWRRGWRTIPD